MVPQTLSPWSLGPDHVCNQKFWIDSCHQDLKSWDLGSKVPISTAEISYYLSCPSPFMGWTSLFQAVCIFQIANLPWLRPKVWRLKVRGSKVHVLNWCLLSFLAWYDTGPKVSGPEVLRFKVRASKLMFQFLCFYGLVLEWYSTKLSGPVVPRLGLGTKIWNFHNVSHFQNLCCASSSMQ